MEGLILAILLIQAIIFGFFSGYIAKEKGRSYFVWFILGLFFSILSILALIAIPRLVDQENSPRGATGNSRDSRSLESSQQDEKDYSGNTDTGSAEYQLYLTKRYKIEKNITLNKFIIDNKVFEDLDLALAYAHGLYEKHLEDKRLGEELRRKREQDLMEQSRLERKLEEERLLFEQARKEERRKEFLTKVKISIVGIGFLVLVYGAWILVEEFQDRKAWNAEGDIVQDCSTCPQLVLIPSGSFTMGISQGDIGHSMYTIPIRKVKINSFLIGRAEVTQAQWQSVMGTNPSRNTGKEEFPGQMKSSPTNNSNLDTAAYPVENVSWIEVQIFLKKLSEKTGKNYRLPSEAEWEYSTRAGSSTPWSFGSNIKDIDLHAWYEGNSSLTTHPMAKKKPNKRGLFDVHGNVSEWVQDTWHDNYIAAPTSGAARESGGTNLDFRVVRGGSYLSTSDGITSGNRTYRSRHEGSGEIGFRVARDQ